MKTVVITGSTRGIGRGLAEAFADRGCMVVVSGRSDEAVQATVAALNEKHPGHAAGRRCEITDAAQLQALWDTAKEHYGGVDIWINNAGISIPRKPLHEADPAELAAIVDTNLTGMLLANKVVIAAMLAQGRGQVWNMEGFGSGGQMQPGMTAYGATKRAVNYMIRSLQKELKGSPVVVGTLSPGIVVTDLLLGDYDPGSAQWAKAKKIFNILGDTVETVTPWLAGQVLAAKGPRPRVAWLTTSKAFGRFLTAGFNKRELFPDP